MFMSYLGNIITLLQQNSATDVSVGFGLPSAPAWYLHTNLCKFGYFWYFYTKYSSDLNLGKSLCTVTYLHFPASWLNLLKDFDFNFDLQYFEWRDTENQQYSKCFVNYFQWTHLEGYSFIRLSCKKKILPWFVWWFNPLFISWHEAMPWSDALCYLWIIHLHIQRNESLLSILKQVKIQ